MNSQSMDQQTILQFVAAIRTEQSQVNEQLISHFGRGLRFFIKRQGFPAEACQDLAQETIIVAIEKIRAGQLENPEQLSAFLLSTARNLCWNARRKQNRRRTELGLQEEPPSQEEDPERQLWRKQLQTSVQNTIKSLKKERDRQILVRFFLLGESRQWIAGSLGISAEEFNLVLFRAKARFRKEWEKQNHKTSSLNGSMALVLVLFWQVAMEESNLGQHAKYFITSTPPRGCSTRVVAHRHHPSLVGPLAARLHHSAWTLPKRPQGCNVPNTDNTLITRDQAGEQLSTLTYPQARPRLGTLPK